VHLYAVRKETFSSIFGHSSCSVSAADLPNGRKVVPSEGFVASLFVLPLHHAIRLFMHCRAAEEMVTVPRGALEELIIRDFASRVHNMDSNTLASFTDSMRSMSAPELRTDYKQTIRSAEPENTSGTYCNLPLIARVLSDRHQSTHTTMFVIFRPQSKKCSAAGGLSAASAFHILFRI
jgi:hypothetical protein